MSKSIVSNDLKCWVCGNTMNLHKHHCYFGVSNRPLSEKYGCWVYLCGPHHNQSNKGVHFDHDLDILIKKTTQREWEKRYGTREDFIKTFGRSYL